MPNTDKVNELVEWVAKTIREFDCSFAGKPECDECATTSEIYWNCVIKQILSHPDLALIKDDQLTVDNAIKAGYIIPLAPAIKEIK